MKKICLSVLIVMFRLLDLLTTYLSNINLEAQEQNIIVKLFKLNIYEFFGVEILLAIMLAFSFYFTYDNSALSIKAKGFNEYINLYFFNKNKVEIKDWLFSVSVKNSFLLFGKIVLLQTMFTSSIFSINNVWVWYVDKNYYSDDKLVALYYQLNNYYFFDFVIFFLPTIIFLTLAYNKLKLNFLKNRVVA